MRNGVMRAILASLGILAAVVWAAPALPEDKPARPIGVLELFTSQGCNSCPKADALFAEIAAQKDVVALAYHVDYWDYLGWRDTLARPENTQRQRDYAKVFDKRSVYTPQAVINGRAHVTGSSRNAVESSFAEMTAAGEGMAVDVKIERVGDRIVIEAGQATQAFGEANVLLVYFDPVRSVEITRGENKGSTIAYWNAVTGFQSAGIWSGKPARFEMPASEIDRKGAGGCAVLLQKLTKDGLPGPVIGAAVLANSGS